jgi:hypothetical protein
MVKRQMSKKENTNYGGHILNSFSVVYSDITASVDRKQRLRVQYLGINFHSRV